MIQSTEVLIFGPTGTGKDELAKIISKNYYHEIVHPISPFKRAGEEYFGHPVGSWDDHKFKTTTILPSVDGFSPTPQDLMVAFYHVGIDLGIKFTQPYIKEIVKCAKPFVYIAIRNPWEVEAIAAGCAEYNKDIIVIDLKSNIRGTNISTDTKQQYCRDWILQNTPHNRKLEFWNNYNDLESLERGFLDALCSLTDPVS